MIIFDLDGTLANCEHRRHFVEKPERCESPYKCCICKKCEQFNEWQPNWSAFYEACDLDKPIYPSWFIFNGVAQWTNIEIWSGRCESVRDKTINWLMNKCPLKPTYWNKESWNRVLKMRPIGDNTPDNVLKERWLMEQCDGMNLDCKTRLPTADSYDIDFVFDSHPASIAMWRRRGIFVFNCAQKDGEF